VKLKEQPGWAALVSRYNKLREERATQLGRQLLQGRPQDQREIDKERGFWLGVDAILHTPEAAEKSLDRAVSKMRRERRGNASE